MTHEVPGSAAPSGIAEPSSLFRLPMSMADFGRRGFRLDRPDARKVLELHARTFLGGFNLAVRNWRDPHPALAAVSAEERGFAYEAAGMFAAIRDFGRRRSGGALDILLDGPGAGYVHLVHVGYGWGSALFGAPLPVRLPRTPLLRWLALDGAGFSRAFFGGLPTLRKMAARRMNPVRESTLAGCGRALWFAESADPAGVAGVIGSAAAPARPHLWAGVGLASCYAGCADDRAFDALITASGAHSAYFAQGAMFAIAARTRSGVVPRFTEVACRYLFTADPDTVASWTETAAEGLTGAIDVSAYLEWKSRLRARAGRL
ncbi:DUF1702 family protein [Amycolatopsis sp. NBC_00345]|uniref:DUF1702 family protein n=1 Tax=Amycolatopsis sp. NBC_00345 TaxID=2975955 RepID=UPI002E25B70B